MGTFSEVPSTQQSMQNQPDIKDNKIMLLEEDLWCVHKYLDGLKLPRADMNGIEYSIVGRIKKLEERYQDITTASPQ